ncbi:MAG: ATP-binding protein [Sediminibacterium sp.]|nr:ATP-binding protein [Sediminibacterium sp.]
MATNHQIILLFFRSGLSIRKIAKKLKIHRGTVSARIKEYEQFKASPISDQDNPKSLLNQYLKTGSIYHSENRGNVICDELGYISFDKQGSEMLFNHLSLRTGLKSTIITSNQSFEKWNDIFGKDTVLTAALLDRLTHKAYMVNMNGQSYRMKETKKIQDSLKTKATLKQQG